VVRSWFRDRRPWSPRISIAPLVAVRRAGNRRRPDQPCEQAPRRWLFVRHAPRQSRRRSAPELEVGTQSLVATPSPTHAPPLAQHPHQHSTSHARVQTLLASTARTSSMLYRRRPDLVRARAFVASLLPRAPRLVPVWLALSRLSGPAGYAFIISWTSLIFVVALPSPTALIISTFHTLRTPNSLTLLYQATGLGSSNSRFPKSRFRAKPCE
jgi:hypothetical protein